MAEELSFRVSTGLKNIIGRELITNRKVAVFELVKNSCDAGASRIDVIFDLQNNQLLICDDGSGMSPDDIKDKWLFIGYSYKATQTDSMYAGAKGIGRFSVDRLGTHLELFSKKDGISSQLDVDWEAFEKDNTREFWQQRVRLTTPDQIPYLSEQDYASGTVLRITDLRDQWDSAGIGEICSALEKLINPIEREHSVTIVVTYITNEGDKNSYDLENKIFDILDRKTISIEAKLSPKNISLTLADNDKVVFDAKLTNPTLLEHMTVKLYFMSQKAKANFTRKMGIRVKQYGSVFVYKNDFRIYPFGEEDYDAFGLNLRKTQGTNRYLAHRELLGWISIVDLDRRFVEVSSRDNGFIQNEYSNELERFFIEVILRSLEAYVYLTKFGKVEIEDNNTYSDFFTQMRRRFKQQNLDLISIDEYELPETAIPIEEKLRLMGDETKSVPERMAAQKSIESNIKNMEAEQKQSELQLKRAESEAALLKRQLQIQKKLFVSAPPERQKYLHHEITKSTREIVAAIERIFANLNDEDRRKNQRYRYEIQKQAKKLNAMQKMVLRLEIDTNKSKVEVDIYDIVEQYVKESNIHFLRPIDVQRSSESSMIRNINIFEFGIVIDNLLQNAYDQKAGYVQIYLTNNSEICVFSENTTIPEENLESIFEMGYTTKEKGYGIGLYMCRDLLKRVTLSIRARNTYNGVEFVIGDE